MESQSPRYRDFLWERATLSSVLCPRVELFGFQFIYVYSMSNDLHFLQISSPLQREFRLKAEREGRRHCWAEEGSIEGMS